MLLLASVFFWQALVRLACGKRGKVRVFGMAVIMAVGQSEPSLSLMRQGDTFFFNCIYDMVIDAKLTPFPLQMATGDEGESGSAAYFAAPPVNLIYAFHASLSLITAKPPASHVPATRPLSPLIFCLLF